jgi:putative PIN family toxin of toxin-antitoxin system
MKVVLDTNVLASAAATRGLCADVLREVLAEHELVICKQITDELKRILIDKFGVAPDLVREFLWLIRQDAATVRPRTVPEVTLKDKDDLGILAAAVASDADALVTGDKELQELSQVERTPILSPRAFWEQLTAQPDKSSVRGRPRR